MSSLDVDTSPGSGHTCGGGEDDGDGDGGEDVKIVLVTWSK